MAQNTRSGVMQQRVEADDSLDDFPTPQWATRALIEHVLKPRLGLGPRLPQLAGLEPCCNRGFMARPMAEYLGRVWASDVHDYGWTGQTQTSDFLFPGFDPCPGISHHADQRMVDLTFANPPFRLALEFIQKARAISRIGCAMLVRTSFLEGGDRYEQLFSKTPPTIVAQFAERVIMHKGVLRDPAVPYWDEETQKMKRPSTATSYCWLVWAHDVPAQPFAWIPPCRRQLERPDDYPVWPDIGAAPPRQP